MNLYEIKQGEKCVITKVKGRGAFRKRIMEMGFVVGKEITVGKKAPLKNPIEYTVMGYEISLRNSEAKLIEVTSHPNCLRNQQHKRQRRYRHQHGNHHTENENFYTKTKIGNNEYNGVIVDNTERRKRKHKHKIINIALVGNPNSGKTTLFNYASHSKEKVGNYSGVTVDAKEAKFKQNGYIFNIVDLPGTYSITSYTPEEIYVRNYIFDEVPDVVVNIVDSSNLERNLFLTTQLIDLDIKVVIALNMYDELLEKDDKFDYETLGKMIGIPMIPTVSSKGKGIKELFNRIIDVFEDRDPTVRHIHINYGTEIEESIKIIQEEIRIEENVKITNIVAPRFLAIKLLERDIEETIRIKNCRNYNEILNTAEKEIYRLEQICKDNSETIITDYKYGFIDGALKETFKKSKKDIRSRSRLIDNILTNKFLSYPVFIFIMWLMFQSTYTLGAYPMSWLEKLVQLFGQLLTNFLPESIFRDLLIDGIVGGVGGVIVFLPNILILFLFISFMEDTGYMARVAFIVDKLMHKIGLHGRSFIPMLMGFGCNVPAIMATRTIGSKNDRLVTMLINPFMSCSARLPVYVLFIGAFFKDHPGMVLFSIYGIGIILSIILAIIFKKTILKAKEIPFVMELPPYRIPTLIATLRHTWYKGSQYLKKMGGIILIASVIIWALGYFPINEDIHTKYNKQIAEVTLNIEEKINLTDSKNTSVIFDLQHQKEKTINNLENIKTQELMRNSMIGKIGHFIEPVIAPLGFNWKMGVSLVAGIAAKEIVVSTLGVLHQAEDIEGVTINLVEKLQDEKNSKGKNVYSPLVSFAFLIFILVYFPCIAVIATIRKESGSWKWAIFMASYSTVLAWILSFLIFQIGSLFL
ncbi:MAG: ferrous iron transport protein B [Bacteroidales bacterium]|nr:ferrous iron transport protein B [Bacteroidales bacterium]